MRGKWLYSLFAIVPLLWLSATIAVAQTTQLDSVNIPLPKTQIFDRQLHKEDSIQKLLNHRTDSLKNHYQSKLDKVDSMESRLQQHNLARRTTTRVDSIQASFYQRSDSLKNALQHKLRFWEKAESKLQKKMDSLSSRNLPGGKVREKLDSINKLRNQTVATFDKKLQSLKERTSKKINDLDLPSEAKEKVAAVTKNIDGVNLSGPDVNIPGMKNISNPLANTSAAGDVTNIPNINSGTLPSGDITKKMGEISAPGIDQTKQLTDINGKGEVSKVTKEVSGYSKEATELANGNVDEVKSLPKAAEEKAADVSGIKTVGQQTKELEEFKNITSKMKDQEALKKEVTEKIKKVAVNHFAGKEEQLKAAMEKVSKYKQKYSSLNGISELSKKPRNKMHGKPLIERIVPGLAIQIQSKGENFLVDFNSYAGYRITGRLGGGLGWNQRIAYNTARKGFNPSARIFGPRTFGEFKLSKGFSPRAEIEIMNTNVPPSLGTIDPTRREWVWGAFVGMKKEYTIFKNIKGTAMVMGRLFNRDHKSPYADVLNVRFGFEFPMKGKKEKVK